MSIIDYSNLKTPCYICEEERLEANLKIFDYVQKASGAKIILALKGYAMWSTFDQIKPYLHGCTASSLHEALLAKNEMGKEVHTYSPAFRDDDFNEIVTLSDHIVFNSVQQLNFFYKRAQSLNSQISIALRVNPECSSSPSDLYDPCGVNSRLGTTLKNFDESIIEKINGLTFHALCEQNVDALESVLFSFEEKFGQYIKKMDYINFGGGHHITRKDYQVDRLINVIKKFKERYSDVDVYLEPGEALGWEVGCLISTVLDIQENGKKIAILDTSAEAHMPDTLAMPYRSNVRDSGLPGEKKYTYQLAGNTCLAGDIMGDYSFDKPLNIGDKIIFEDQIHYTFVKNTTFNGINLPSLALQTKDNKIKIVKTFGFNDYKNRLS